ncbi:MAG: M20/M25/M40 family metallo-hydrolase [Candidatus Promineifilaceae bacterium]|nr:M20/M25/M40 family metallo-hydrolase [Candidatus Promineifilaceae bacterium]
MAPDHSLLDDCIRFTQRLIQTPSMPGEEAAIARLIDDELELLGFDDVWIDGAGNVNGRIHGEARDLPALVLNTHLDHVDPGDPALWPAPPYSGTIIDGRIVGRGAADIKGPLAVQVYSMAGLLREGGRPRRDVVFTGVVEEEVGGAGAVYWIEHLDYEVGLLVLGEPSSNELALGHRGILQMWVTFPGRSVHASVPRAGENPNYALAAFLQRLEEMQGKLSAHELLGKTTVAPTIVEVDTTSMNVTPAWTRVLLDFRTASESTDSLAAFVRAVAGDLPHTLSPAWGEPGANLHQSDESIFGFYTAPESDIVQRVQAALARGMGRTPELTSYRFATDGRHFVDYDIPMVGYSPAEEAQAHTAGESISIEMMAESLRGHMALLRDF